MLAAYALVGKAGDLPGQAPQHDLIQFRRFAALQPAMNGLDPDFTRTVDKDIGDIGPFQHRREGRQIGSQIDGRRVGVHGSGFTAEKSRSRATKIVTAAPCSTSMVGAISPGGTAVAAAPKAAAGDPMAIWVEATWDTAFTPAFSTDNRIAPPKRAKKWVSTSPVNPPRPKASPPGEPICTVTPSGRITRLQMMKTRDWPSDMALRYWPITRLPRGIRTCLPSKPSTSWRTTART